MAVDIGYLRAIQGTLGLSNETQYQREDAKDNLRWQLLESVNCEHDAKVNGGPQKLIVTKTDNVRVMNVTALPGERLLQGDLCEFYGHHWIIVRLYATDNIQMTGRAYQCNHLFRFQLGDFRFQRLFNHRRREDFFFFACADNNLTIGNVR